MPRSPHTSAKSRAVEALSDLLVSAPWRRSLLRLSFAMRGRWRSRPFVAFENQIRNAVARRGPYVVDVRLRGGGKLAVDLSDHFHQVIAATGTYEAPTTALLTRIVEPGTTFFDVGANAGYFSVLAARLGAEVHTFEPNPRMVALLRRSAVPGAVVNQTAVGDQIGTVSLHLSPNASHSGTSSVLSGIPHLAGAEQVEVAITTLDAYCAEYDVEPDVLKIDVEGHEEAVIDGMRVILERRRPGHLIIELRLYPGFPDPGPIAEKVRSYGYDAFALTKDGNLHPLTTETLFANDNVYFVRSDLAPR